MSFSYSITTVKDTERWKMTSFLPLEHLSDYSFACSFYRFLLDYMIKLTNFFEKVQSRSKSCKLLF